MAGQPPTSYDPWEYALVSRAVMTGQLDSGKAEHVLAALTLEALTQIATDATIRMTWEARSNRLLDCAAVSSGLHLPGDRLQQLLKDARDLSQLLPSDRPVHAWIDRGLSLDAGIELDDSRQHTALSLQPLFNGRRTFWDLALKLNQSPAMTARMLGYFFRQQLLTFQVLPDLEFPPMLSSTGYATPATKTEPPLVVCIDDSMVVLQRLERIVTQAGYRFCGMRDSVQALTQLIELKPDLILLDVVMPVVNGYEICAQIRRVKALEHTPIVILTGHDGTIDRVRAKLARASEFLSKVSDSGQILATLERHLPSHNSTRPHPPHPDPALPGRTANGQDQGAGFSVNSSPSAFKSALA
jgi:chemotaxis family two-component system response regulator PixG